MRRTTLLLLLATTATCYGQSNADTPADRLPNGSSYIDESRPAIEQSTEEAEPIEQSNEEAGSIEQGNEETGSIKRRNEETERIERSRGEIGRVGQGGEEAGRVEQSDEETMRAEQSHEETRRVEQSSEEAERAEQNNEETEHFYRIRQDEEMEDLRRQQYPENIFSPPVQHSHNRQYKQTERSSVSSAGHAAKSKLPYHTTPATHKQSLNSSRKSYNQQSDGVYRNGKGNTNRN